MSNHLHNGKRFLFLMDNIVFRMEIWLVYMQNRLAIQGPGGSMSQVGLPNNSYKPIVNTAWVRVRLCRLQKGCTRLASASDKVYQLLAHDRWFSPGTPASSTTKTGRHDIAEILLKVTFKHQNSIPISYICDTTDNNNTMISNLVTIHFSYTQKPKDLKANFREGLLKDF